MSNHSPDQDQDQDQDIIIIGAGIWGLSAAHTFLTLNPSLSLLLLDAKRSIGGVWAKEQLYPGLRTNNIQGYYEFSDYPLLDAGLGVEERGLLTGEVVHEYLVRFAEWAGLVPRVRLGWEVVRAVERSGGWELDVRVVRGGGGGGGGGDEQSKMVVLRCGKLVVATGNASAPFRPSFRGEASFGAPIVHSVDLGKNVQRLLDEGDDDDDDTAAAAVKSVTVLGGSKSAHDAVYLFATAGKKVTWIIHPSNAGRGAVPMVVPYMRFGRWKVWLEELFMLRFMSWLGPAPWSDGDGFAWIRRFLHCTRLGTRIVRAVFDELGRRAARDSGITRDASTGHLLKPGASLMWYGTQSNVLTYDSDSYELVRQSGVEIKLGHVESLSPHLVTLADGSTIPASALILATGYDWSATVPLEPATKRLGWGVPVDPVSDTIYPALDAASDQALLAQYPLLASSPHKPPRLPSKTPWRLWRSLAPPSQLPLGPKRNLVFLNTIASYQSFTRSELTSLWAYAYLHDRLSVPTPSPAQARREISLWTRFAKWRAPYGGQGKWTDFLLDAMPYYDLLLRDLGLRSWRKGCGWWGEVFGGAYGVKDYRGVVGEWRDAQVGVVVNGEPDEGEGKKGR